MNNSIIQYRSIKSLMADIIDDFEITNSDWYYKSIGWIARALEIMRIWNGYDKVSYKVNIVDYKGLLPCNINSILFVTNSANRYVPIVSDFTLASSCSCPSEIEPCNDTVIINQSAVQTSFATGWIKVHYYGIPKDEDGIPLIPDDAFVTEAIGWYVVMKMITSGYKHKVITNWKEAKNEWEVAYPRAQNSCNYPSPEKMQGLVDVWTTIVKDTNMVKYYFS